MTDAADNTVQLKIGLDPSSINALYVQVAQIVSELSGLVIQLKVDTNTQEATDAAGQLDDEVKKVNDELEDTGAKGKKGGEEAAGGMNTLMGAVQGLAQVLASVGLSKFLGSIIKSASDSEDALVRLQGALAASGQEVSGLSAQYQQLATSIQKSTQFSDESILDLIATLTQLGVASKDIDAATRTIADFAAATGMSIENAAMLVGRALEGQITSLRRYGITINEAAVKARGAGAVLEELQKRFGGAAANQVNTFTGALKVSANAWDDLKETLGAVFTQDTVIREFLKTVTDLIVGINDWLQQNPILAKTIIYITTAITGLIAVMGALQIVMSLGLVKAFGTLVTYLVSFSVQATVASASAKALTISLVSMKTAAAAAATGIGIGFVTVAVAGLAAAYAETKRLEAEIKRLEEEALKQQQDFLDRRYAGAERRALAAVAVGDEKEVQRNLAIAAAVGRESELTNRIFEERQKISAEIEKQRATLNQSALAYADSLGLVRAELYNIDTMTESGVSKFIALRGQVVAVEQALRDAALSLDPKLGATAFNDAILNAQTSVTELVSKLRQMEAAGIDTGKASGALLKAFGDTLKPNDELLKSLQQQNAQYSDLVKKAMDLGLVSRQQAITDLDAVLIRNKELVAAGKINDVSNKHIALTKIENELTTQTKAITQAIAAEEERREQLDNRKKAALEKIQEIQLGILEDQARGTETLQDDLALLEKRRAIELAAAKGGPAEEAAAVELQYTRDRLQIEERIKQTRADAAAELVAQTKQAQDDLLGFIAGVEERVMRAQGKGALVDLQKEIASINEQVKNVQTEVQGGQLQKAAESLLAESVKPLREAAEESHKKLKDLNQQLEDLTGEYFVEKRQVIASTKAGPERAAALQALDVKYREKGLSLKDDIKSAEEQAAKDDALVKEGEDLRRKELDALQQSVNLRIAENEMRAAAIEEQKIQEAAMAEQAQKQLAPEVPPAGAEAAAAVVAVPITAPVVTPEALAQVQTVTDQVNTAITNVDGAFSSITTSLEGTVTAQQNFATVLANFAETTVDKFGEMTQTYDSLTAKLTDLQTQLKAMSGAAGELADKGLK
jgi:hypothetical protein